MKAASLGDQTDMTKEEEDAAVQATELLVHNAQNLMMSVKDTVRSHIVVYDNVVLLLKEMTAGNYVCLFVNFGFNSVSTLSVLENDKLRALKVLEKPFVVKVLRKT